MKNNSLIGRSLDHYKIDRLLGRGGMADVYHGTDVKLHRSVAIKVFDSRSRTSSSQANRFLQEARMMAQWRHTNIVQIYSVGEATGLLYYAMEYIDGYDLASIMQVYAEKGELMPFADVLRIGDAIASALDYAHAKGVIHRDVKPANVMIANDGRVVLGDFGLALDLKAITQGEVFGSPHYISPEQARRSSEAVPQSDLYSLGVILYEILTGVTPFNDPSPASLALQHITEEPPLPRLINPALSLAVEAVLLKALEKKTSDRYQSGKNLMDALRKALVTKPVTLPKDAPPLPPIPVGAPAVQRSAISLNDFTKRRDVITALEQRSAIKPDLAQAPTKKIFRIGWALLAVILFFACLALTINFYPMLSLAVKEPTQTVSLSATIAAPTSTDTQSSIANTETLLPASPTFTETVVVPSVTVVASITATQNPITTPTETVVTPATATITLSPSGVKYPNGYLMTAFYNASSFYLLDRGKASRSGSGFSFERVNKDGSFENHFGGWEWEKYFKVIQPDRCLSLELFPTTIPYLTQVGCDKHVLSNLRFDPASPNIFWTPTDKSSEFRVLWLDEEVARCSISAGTCDIYVP